MLKGWSHNDDRMDGRTLVWTEGEDATMLLPATGDAGRELEIEARSYSGTARVPDRIGRARPGDMRFRRRMGALPASAARCHRAGRSPDGVALRPAGPVTQYFARYIGGTGVGAPVDLAVAVAGEGAGEYADIYVEGKRYSTDRDCVSCVGVVALPAGDAGAVDWRQFDVSDSIQAAEMLAWLDDTPAGTVLLLAARAGAPLSPAMLATLVEYGADDAWNAGDDAAHLWIGVRGAPAGTAIERACGDGCVEYLGERWPKHGVAVSSVEIGL